MADTVHGTGGQTYEQNRRRMPPELGVFIALIVIVVIFEVLGALVVEQSLLFDTKGRFDGPLGLFNVARLKIMILQVSIIGIILRVQRKALPQRPGISQTAADEAGHRLRGTRQRDPALRRPRRDAGHRAGDHGTVDRCSFPQVAGTAAASLQRPRSGRGFPLPPLLPASGVFTLTQVSDRPLHGRVFLEEVLRENLDLGRIDNVRVTFDRAA